VAKDASDSPSLAERVVDARFGRDEGELTIGGLRASEIVAEHGTPLYVFDASVLRAQLASVKAALGPRVQVLFALKANPNAAVARVLREGGAGAEVASAGEIHVARRAGFEGGQMQFAGPGKHGADLDLALEDGVTLNVESLAELEAIDAAAAATGKVATIALRVNPPDAKAGSRMRMGGGSAKFGIDADVLGEVAKAAESKDHVELVGLHTYAGTQTFDADGWLTHARFLLETSAATEGAIGRELQTLNFGGGFGVATFDNDGTFDLARAGEGLRALIAEDDRPSRRYFVELGRYLVAESGVYLTRVVYTKESRGKRHAILDGGMNQHAAAAGLGTVIRRSFPMVHAGALDAEVAEGGCQLGGPLCTPADAFPTSKALPALQRGDLVAFLVSGAYGLTFSNVLFLSHGLPAEVLVDGGEAHVIRDRGAPEDALRGQRLP